MFTSILTMFQSYQDDLEGENESLTAIKSHLQLERFPAPVGLESRPLGQQASALCYRGSLLSSITTVLEWKNGCKAILRPFPQGFIHTMAMGG